ncbi:hypothetical protein ET007_02510 [Lactococcus garvieae]|jgi:predicted transcriptional regulator|uniref:hypothetical protein n=1 Tax=Lactococcus formosensis TaxID=1281486 RepID=UPI0013FD6080|nr:hypothetical protein [Lactococcus garvieae]NHJ17818.1 hypothetical protein [Lactococcus garvieae]
MSDQKKRKAIYNPEADKRYLETLTTEQKIEKNRRAAFTRARNFIRDKKYTEEEFQELKNLIEAHEKSFKK